MKPYTQPELRTFVSQEASSLVGAQLQEVLANDRGLALGFWKAGTSWLILDLLPNSPLALVFRERCPFSKSPQQKPLSLFLRSHGRNKILREVSLLEEHGRALLFRLSNQEGECEIEVHLIPKQVNVIVRAGGKQVAWEKPREMTPGPPVGEFPAERAMEDVREGWLQEQRGGKTSRDPEEQWRKKHDRDLEKKRKALQEIEASLAKDEGAGWYARGDAMKSGGEFIDASQSLAWNLNEAYGRAKKSVAKKAGTEERRRLLAAEIAALEKATYASSLAEKAARPGPAPGRDLMAQAEAKGRKLALEKGVTAYIGRSAADNLALLRKARAWDYWLHLRDYPGAHAIVHRQRDQVIADAELRQIALWLARESLGSKAQALGQKLEVVVAECRHVRPIKGDKLGRVNYHHERQFSVEWTR
ncbi:MAG: DUF814 domain-containing protein [Bdellovibrionaceae bacterium]|nr:DUF814 domain-containing protein [Pseudobdellovibrionaceae bacterium]